MEQNSDYQFNTRTLCSSLDASNFNTIKSGQQKRGIGRGREIGAWGGWKGRVRSLRGRGDQGYNLNNSSCDLCGKPGYFNNCCRFHIHEEANGLMQNTRSPHNTKNNDWGNNKRNNNSSWGTGPSNKLNGKNRFGANTAQGFSQNDAEKLRRDETGS